MCLTKALNHRLGIDQLQQSTLKNIEFIQVCELLPDTYVSSVELDSVKFEMFTYLLQDDQQDSEFSTKIILPSVDLLDQWENLVFDDDLKLSLLDYMNTGLLFGDLEVNSNIIAVNRVLLLYGPPGTGKTTLCRSLAQKITIRLAERYKKGVLIEIKSHALFSKFFAQSSKLILSIFDDLHKMLDDEDCFVCVLMGKVVELTYR